MYYSNFSIQILDFYVVFFLSNIQFALIANIFTILSYYKSVTSGDRNCYPSEAPVF